MTTGTGALRSGALLDQLPLVTYVAPVERPCAVDYVSPQIEALLGFAAEEWVEEPTFWLGRVAIEDQELYRRACAAVRSAGEQTSVEYRLLARDGRAVWVRDVAVVVDAEDGSSSIHGFLTDITREKELELALAREQAQTDAFFRDSSVGMAITDAEGRYVRVNEALARMHGKPAEEHIGKRLRDVQPMLAGYVEPLLDDVWRTGEALQGHRLDIDLGAGRTANVLVSYFPVDAAGAQHFGGIVVDVTELHRSLRESAEAEREYRRLIEQLPLVTYVNRFEPERRASYISPQVEQMFGLPVSEWLADADLWDTVVHPDDRKRVRDQESEARGSNGHLECEYRIVLPDGTIRWVIDRMHTEYDETGAPQFEEGFVVDITDRKRAELAELEAIDALRVSEEQFRAVFDNALDAMVVADDDGRYLDVNPAACKLFGLTHDELILLSVADVSQSRLAPGEAWGAFLDNGSAAGQYTIVRPDGTTREIEGSATANVLPGRHLSIIRDVTERNRLERALWQAQKLESVGTLAGGVAHDFNNMLMAISGYASLLLARLASGSVEHQHAEEIEQAAGRAAKLTAQLLAFGRRQVLQPRVVDLNAQLTDLSPMLARVVGSEATLEVDLDPELDAALADPAQLEHVILNIVVNAAEAMPAGGTIAIRTRNVEVEHDIEAAAGITARELAGGRYVELAISDSGPGLDPTTIDHVFEPFFTTKEVGLGEGLGLSTAYGIVKQSGGTIVADSGSGAGPGATFRIYLPATGEARDLNGGHEGPVPQ